MIEKLKEALGMLSGYKQKYEDKVVELNKAKVEIGEADVLAAEILALLKGWDASK